VAATFAWVTFCICNFVFAPALLGQAMDDSIVAKHVRLRIPVDRQWLGRETISDLERCWEFVDSATGAKLPTRVLIVIQWQNSMTAVDAEHATLSIGMGDPAASSDAKGYLLHSAARELARLALINLSGGAASKEENWFLLQGMSEMVAHDFSNTVKRLGAAWAICYYLDRMSPLGLKQLASRAEISGSQIDLRSAAPGITLLTACGELFGRERLFKLFESLARKNLEESLTATFKTQASNLVNQWLARVRNYNAADVTITTAEEAPELNRVMFVPDPAKAGGTLRVQLFARDGANDLSPTGIFVLDESSHLVLQGNQGGTEGSRYTQFEIPIDAARPEGRYKLRLVAVDEGGNVRNWEAFYSIAR
jgi:hypothetical protein